jgi:hypothetical protein
MMLGDSTFLTPGHVEGAEASALHAPPPPPVLTSLDLGADVVPFEGVAEIWGSVSIPTQPAIAGQVSGDGLLSIYLSYLKAFLQTDGNATGGWSAIAPGRPIVNRVRPHTPHDSDAEPDGLGFDTKDLPALYLWRGGQHESTKVEYIAEDWQIGTAMLKLLWVFPLGVISHQRVRQSFGDAVAKAIITAIELGRTPSWQWPGDPDPLAPAFGSFVHTFTNVFSLNVTEWKPESVDIIMTADDKSSRRLRYPAIEVTLELVENRQRDVRRWSAPSALQQTLTGGRPSLPAWAPGQVYASNDFIQATPVGSSTPFAYKAYSLSGMGVTGNQSPAWPTVVGATVADGASLTWTCKGAVPPSVISRVGEGGVAIQ